VAQSRARLGMYFVGNQDTLADTKHWNRLLSDLQSRNRIGKYMPLCCPKHPRICLNAEPKDTCQVIAQGICGEPCGQLMACGEHRCQRRCHGGDEHHNICKEKVEDTCSEGHAISRLCFQAAANVKCRTCEKIAQEEREKARKEWEERESRARKDCEQQCKAIRQRPPQPTRVDLKKHGEDAVEFIRVVDRTERYVQADHGRPIIVSRIEKLVNPQLEARFYEAKMKLKSGAAECRMMALWHGTGEGGVEGIPRTGFRLPDWSEENMFGQGAYFATDSSKSAQEMYTKGTHCLILCDVLLGKACEVPGLSSQHPLAKHVKRSKKGRLFLDVDLIKVRGAGFDSVFAPRNTRDKAGVQYDEMIVYDPAQALPRYIVHFNGGSAQSMPAWRGNAGNAGCRTLKAADIGSHDSRELREFNMAAAQYMRLLRTGKEVSQVDVYENPAVQAKFQAKEEEFRTAGKPTQPVWVFHGTPNSDNIPKICSGGFLVGGQDGHPIQNGAAHGQGVYTAKGPGTPMGYAQGTSAVILCLSLPGITGAQGTDDSWAPNGDWMIFKTSGQVWPRYVVHYCS